MRGSIWKLRATAAGSMDSAPGAIPGSGGVALLLWQDIGVSMCAMHRSGKLALGCFSGICAATLAGCGVFTPAHEVRAYPEGVEQSRVVDIQAYRDGTELVITNTTAERWEQGTVWLNGQFSYPFGGLDLGDSLRMPLGGFRNEHGEAFRAGGFFSTERPDTVVLVQLEQGEELVGVVVVQGRQP